MEITQLWKDYQDGRSYQNSLSLQKTIEENVRFYQGEQWAPITEATAHLPRYQYGKDDCAKQKGCYFVNAGTPCVYR